MLIALGNAVADECQPNPGFTPATYIRNEARRRGVFPWELPGLEFLAPPPIGDTIAFARRLPDTYIDALNRIHQVTRGGEVPANIFEWAWNGNIPSHLWKTMDRITGSRGASQAFWEWAWKGGGPLMTERANPPGWVAVYVAECARRTAAAQGANDAAQKAAVETAVEAIHEDLVADVQKTAAVQIVKNQIRTAALQQQLDIVKKFDPAEISKQVGEKIGETLKNLFEGAGDAFIPDIGFGKYLKWLAVGGTVVAVGGGIWLARRAILAHPAARAVQAVRS